MKTHRIAPSTPGLLAGGTVLVLLGISGAPALANGLGQNGAWDFMSPAERSIRAVQAEAIEKKKGGFYEASRPVYNSTTVIDKQYNCTLSATPTANSGTNSTSANSPTVSNAGQTTASSSANGATNGLALSTAAGLSIADVSVPTPASTLANSQSNAGALASGVTGSSNAASTGAVTAGGGSTDMVLNSRQSNTGTLTASIAGSTACSGLVR